MMFDGVRRFLRLKKRPEIEREVLAEPTTQRAMKAIETGDRIAHEIEALERRQGRGHER